METGDIESRFASLRSVGEECVSEPELKNLLLKKPNFALYDGFEPSGRMHIAQGVFKAMNVNKCTQAGGTFIFWVADWFALMNDKMNGDLEKIKTVGQYLIEVWKAAGMDMEHVKFLWSSEEIINNADQYWTQALDIARVFTLQRVKKCCQIMGRKKGNLTAAQILYPIMQCTDIFFLRADICQLGVDQRKVNMLARDYCEHSGRKLKPIVLSHHMIYGLLEGQQKMSKSDPESAIFMEDTEEDIHRKINNAYCPREPATAQVPVDEEESMRLVEDLLMNPCLDYLRYIIFSVPTATFEAGGVTYTDYSSAEQAFLKGLLSEEEFKKALATALNTLVSPVRDHFTTNSEARSLLEKITQYNKEPKRSITCFRRLSVNLTNNPHVVFSPLAESRFTVGSLLTIVHELEAAPEGCEETILWIRDWSSFCCNKLGGDKKVIASAYSLLVAALHAVAPDLMAKVRVVYQGQAILSNSSDYWISVINAGRKFSLNRVREVDRNDKHASQVISSLMHVADVLATGAASIACLETEKGLHQLAFDFYEQVETSLPIPKLLIVEPVSSLLSRPNDPSGAQKLYLLLTDSPTDLATKMKKSFCEPCNVVENPPLSLARDVCFRFSNRLVVKRKPTDGGDKEFSSFEDLCSEFESGGLHPADMKPAITASVSELLVSKTAAAFKNADRKRDLTVLAAFNKKNPQ